MKGIIVSVAYNPPLSLAENLASDFLPHLVVDNSFEESIWLKDLCRDKGYQYYWMGGNVGIAAALNCGAKLAVEQGYSYIVTMDQDSRLSNELLTQLNNFIEADTFSERCAIVSPLHIINGLRDDYQGVEVKDDPLFSMTSGNWVNLHIWQELGGFDERLFIDGVDIDYYLRAHLAGYKVLTLCNIHMSHNLGSNCKTYRLFGFNIEVMNHSAIRKYYIARNYLYLYQTYKHQYPHVVMLIKILLKSFIAIIFFEKCKLSKLQLFALGFFDGYRRNLGKLK